MELDGIIEPTLHSVKLDEKINAEWLDHFCRLNNVEEKNKDTMIQMLSNIATKKCLISLYNKDLNSRESAQSGVEITSKVKPPF
jgi:hypothetical protein